MTESIEDGVAGGEWRTYRCPVCSHTDGVSLAGTQTVLIRCSHCDTPLDIQRKGSDSVAVTVSSARTRRQRERA
jgi:uncharacterized Zn finger protein